MRRHQSSDGIHLAQRQEGACEHNAVSQRNRHSIYDTSPVSGFGNVWSDVGTSALIELAPTMPEHRDTLLWERAETNRSRIHQRRFCIPQSCGNELFCDLCGERLQKFTAWLRGKRGSPVTSCVHISTTVLRYELDSVSTAA